MKRYIAQPGDWAMAESKDGAWMRYEDHAAEVARLTAALEAAERETEAAKDAWGQARLMNQVEVAESRAEALKARVAELEAENEQITARYQEERAAHDRLLDEAEHYSDTCQKLRGRADAAESELADLRGRVEQAIAALSVEPVRGSDKLVMEILRGR